MLMQDFAASLSYKALPEDVLKVLRRSLLDSLGVAAIGSQTEMARIGTKTARMMFGATSASAARCLFDGNVASLAGAAMAGAMTIDSIDAMMAPPLAKVMQDLRSFQRFWFWPMNAV